jgi:hypothetical protein
MQGALTGCACVKEPCGMTLPWQDTVPPPANVVCDAVDRLDSKLDRAAYAAQIAHAAETWTMYYVDEARAAGASWETIGTALGVTRQAVQQRFRNYAKAGL